MTSNPLIPCKMSQAWKIGRASYWFPLSLNVTKNPFNLPLLRNCRPALVLECWRHSTECHKSNKFNLRTRACWDVRQRPSRRACYIGCHLHPGRFGTYSGLARIENEEHHYDSQRHARFVTPGYNKEKIWFRLSSVWEAQWNQPNTFFENA